MTGGRRIEVEVGRAGHVESVHVAWACVVGPDGAVVEALPAAAPELPVFLRSAAKPLQALAAVRAGTLEALALDDRHLAVACASHVGRGEHVARVRAVLAAARLPESALRCGVDGPADPAAARALASRGRAPGPIHHNCSGNHALALARAVQAGWDVETYLEPGHPLQVELRADVRAATGVAAEEGVDGCGMPAYRVPLAALACAFGRLAGGALGPEGARVGTAMRAHPHLVRGDGTPDEVLMRAVPGLVAKVGAEAVIGIGLADGHGAALKVLDGGWRALGPAAIALAEHLGLVDGTDPELAACAAPIVTNVRGIPVGRLRARVTSAHG